MLDLKYIRENAEAVKINTSNKNETADIELILELDSKRRELVQEADALKAQRNQVSKEIANLKKNKQDATEQINSMQEVSGKVKQLDDDLRTLDANLRSALLKVPNMLDERVPIGKTEADNKVIRSWGTPDESGTGKDHIEIATELELIDFKRGAKVSGAGFAFYTGKGAAIERALINFFLDSHIKNGYYELMPPFVVNENSMTGTGQLPKMAEDMYHCTEDNLFLIPTAEVPVTNFYSGEMIKENDLTTKLCAYSPCFRREAGSYGKDVHGFLRVHQFNKVEMVKFTKPEESREELESLVIDVESLLQSLGLTYRVLLLCSGDTSFASSMTYDLEVWSPGEKKWLEVSSCSNFQDFQSRRANIRFKRSADAKPEFVHTLNGSGIATPRIMVALLETYYKDGKIELPSALDIYLSLNS